MGLIHERLRYFLFILMIFMNVGENGCAKILISNLVLLTELIM